MAKLRRQLTDLRATRTHHAEQVERHRSRLEIATAAVTDADEAAVRMISRSVDVMRGLVSRVGTGAAAAAAVSSSLGSAASLVEQAQLLWTPSVPAKSAPKPAANAGGNDDDDDDENTVAGGSS